MVTNSLSAKKMLRRPLTWHVNWAILALLVAPYVVAAIWFAFSTRFWSSAGPPFAEFIITHRSLIMSGTAIMAAISTLFFLWPRDGGRLTGWWSGFVGLAFGAFLVQYSLRFADLQLQGTLGSIAARVVHQGLEIIIYIFSALNNLLFLAAARILLNKNRKLRELPTSPRGRHVRGFKRRLTEDFQLIKRKAVVAFEEFNGALPGWAWVAACLAPLAILDTKPGLLWARFPDAVFSAYCLAWFGYATAINLNVRSRAILALLALLIALVYGAAQVVLAANPIIAYTAPPNTSRTFPLPWVREKLGQRVNDLTVEIKDKLSPPGQSATAQRDAKPEITPKEVLDGALYALLLPMKVALFIPIFFLYQLFISSVNDFRYALNEAISERQDYLSSDGIVKGIGESLEAEEVSLFIRIPGVQNRLGVEEERVLPLAWDAADRAVSSRQEDPFPIDDDPLLVKVMKKEGTEILEPLAAEADRPSRAEENFPWLVPVKFHNGVVGALRATLKSYRKNYTTLQKLRLMADIVAPSVQDFRSLAAADQIGARFTRLRVDNPKDSFEDAAERIVDVLHDVLAPLATRMTVEVGFQPTKPIYPKQVCERELIENRVVRRPVGEEVSVMDILMLFWTGDGPKDGYQPVGTLSLAIRAKKDLFSRPTLAAYHLTRKMATSFATDGLFDAARESLGAVIKDLGVKFSKEALTLEEWFDAIARAAIKVGLTWAVVTNGLEEESHCPEDEEIKVIRTFGNEERETLSKSTLSTLSTEHPPAAPAVSLRLNRSGHQLWFGLARPEFGPELTFESPWKVFLHEFKDVADTALKSLQQRQLTEAEKIKTAQYQGVMTIAVTTGTLMHQLLNMIKDQLSATEVLEEVLGDGAGHLNPRASRLLRTMRKSAEKMQALTETFKNVTKMEERRPCSLKDAADQALRLFEVSLDQRRIKVTVKDSLDAEVDVPFYVAAFALANLIGNAKDAVRAHGWIEIEAEDNDTFILCHVTNNGPKIPTAVQEGLFQFGRSSKHGHNGWGLYFVEKSLSESGGAIRLAYSNSEMTRFTVRLPKPKPT